MSRIHIFSENTGRTLCGLSDGLDAEDKPHHADCKKCVALWLASGKKDEYNATAGEACRAAGLTEEALEAGVVADLVEALRPFARFVEAWDRKPLGAIDDEFYAIHVGTEFEASLKLTDCKATLDVLRKARPEQEPAR